jgi:hypothetical protein
MDAPAPAPSSGGAGGAEGTSTGAMDQALASQEALMAKNLQMNTAMAWLQAAQDLAKKLKG